MDVTRPLVESWHVVRGRVWWRHRRPVVVDLRHADPAFERALVTLDEPLPIPEQRGEWR